MCINGVDTESLWEHYMSKKKKITFVDVENVDQAGPNDPVFGVDDNKIKKGAVEEKETKKD